MNWKARIQDWLSPVVYLSGNWISRIGVAVVTTSAVFWILLVPALLVGRTESPYLGILGFLILPAGLVAGLILIPVGVASRRAKLRKRGAAPAEFPPVTLASPQFRKLLRFVLVTSVANIAIAGMGGYNAVTYMETNAFCGRVCHTVMEPQYTALAAGAHSRLACVDCHVASGAAGFAQAKLNGIGQLAALALGRYERPVSMPPEKRLPAAETCQKCHSAGQRRQTLRVLEKFQEDEKSTPLATVLVMRTAAIHGAHTGSTRIRFAADQKLLSIGRVEVERGGKTTVFEAAGGGPVGREMDCLDCHNRPAHSFETPERAVDEAISRGAISRRLPFARKRAVDALKRGFPDGGELAAIYRRNVFPAMRVGWGAYPNLLGHTESPGCFRCHDGGHTTAGGATIGQDCSSCHNLIAMDEAAPAVLRELGIARAN
jgi:hypothetical protein